MTDTPTEREVDSTWTSLRRRKVVQWGLVYVAAAWGFLQGLEYVGESFNWPQEVRQIALLTLVIGLPIVLVLAWYHGDRGEQRISTPEFAILTLLLLLGGGAFWYYQRASDAEKTAVAVDSKQSIATPETGALRLAVLPLESLSPDPANAFFADGLHDEILSAMSATPDLQVVSRTTMRTYEGTTKTVKQIAIELGASHLLEELAVFQRPSASVASGGSRRSSRRRRSSAQVREGVREVCRSAERSKGHRRSALIALTIDFFPIPR